MHKKKIKIHGLGGTKDSAVSLMWCLLVQIGGSVRNNYGKINYETNEQGNIYLNQSAKNYLSTFRTG
jgi:hypothetical protein